MMDYEIVATLGPASETEPIWAELLAAGATSFRLNTSHLSLDRLSRWLERLERFLASQEPRPPVVLDLQGSKWRLGQFEPFTLQARDTVMLVHAAQAETARTLPVPHDDFFQAAPVSPGEIVLNDAKTRLRMEKTGEDCIQARVVLGGLLSPGKGITLPGSGFRAESLQEKDRAILAATGGLEGVRYALSYVRDAIELGHYRAKFGDQAYLIAKLERGPALENVAGIAALSDALWLCRGDLGAELGLGAMAEAVHGFSRQVGRLAMPVLMAGQVLEHMAEHPTPTRSEICYLYETLAAGYRGVVLSDEVVIGRYPVEACRAAAMFRKVGQENGDRS